MKTLIITLCLSMLVGCASTGGYYDSHPGQDLTYQAMESTTICP